MAWEEVDGDPFKKPEPSAQTAPDLPPKPVESPVASAPIMAPLATATVPETALPASSILPPQLQNRAPGAPGIDMAGWEEVEGNPFAEPAPQKGIAGVAGEALTSGLREGFGAAEQGLTAPFSLPGQEGPKNSEQLQKLLDTPLTEGWWKPDVLAAHMIHGMSSGAPALTMGAAGAIAGSEYGPGGQLAGSGLGFGMGSALQTVAPAYQRARADGLDHDAAVTRAMKETGIAGAFGAMMGLAPGMSLFGTTAENALKRPIGEALAQIFGIQPALAVGQQAAISASEDKGLPTGKEALNTALETVLPGAALVGGHAAIKAAHGAVTGPGETTPPKVRFEGKPWGAGGDITGGLPRPEQPGGAGEQKALPRPLRTEELPIKPDEAPPAGGAGGGPTPTEAEHIARINEAAARMLPHGVNEVNVFRNDAGDIVVPKTNHTAPYDAPKGLYSYGTEKGLGADLVGLGKAKAAEASGQHPEDIWNNFGWYHDPHDKLWIRHIDDSQAKVKPEATAEWEKNVANPPASGELFRGKLSDFIDHPELFKDTPAAGDTEFVVKKPDPTSRVGGWFSPNGRGITVIAPDLNPASAVKTAIHEIDHFMQSEHNRTNGGSSERMHAMNWMALHDIKQQLRHIEQTGEGKGMVPWLLDQQYAIRKTMGYLEPRAGQPGPSPEAYRSYRQIHGENMAEAAAQANEAEKRRPGAGGEFPERHMETSPRETHPRNKPVKMVHDQTAPARKEAVHRAFEEITTETPFLRRDESSPLRFSVGEGAGISEISHEPEGLVREIARSGGHVVRQRIEESIHSAKETEATHATMARLYERDARKYGAKLAEEDPEKAFKTEDLWAGMKHANDRLDTAAAGLASLYASDKEAGDRPPETYSSLAWDVLDGLKTVQSAAPGRPMLQSLISEWVQAQRDFSALSKQRFQPKAGELGIDPGYIRAMEEAQTSERVLEDHRRHMRNLETAKDVVSLAIEHGGDAVAFKSGVKFEPVEGIPQAPVQEINPQERNKLVHDLGSKVAARSIELTGHKLTEPEAQMLVRHHVADPLNKYKTPETRAIENAFPEDVANLRDVLEAEHYAYLRNVYGPSGAPNDAQAELSPAHGLPAQGQAFPGRSGQTPGGQSGPYGPSGAGERAPARGRGVAGTETVGLPGFTGVVTADKPLAGRTDRRTYRVYPEGLKFNRLQPPLKQHGEPLGYAVISRHPDGRWQVDDVDTSRAPGQRIAPKLYDAIEQHLGAKIEPSGYLTKDGYEKLWGRRDPEAVKWHRWSKYQGHYLSPLQVRNMLDLIERRLSEPGLDLKSEFARSLPAERADLAHIWDSLPREAQDAAKPEMMFSLPKEGQKGEVNDAGFVLALPHDDWGNPRFDEKDQDRALTRLADIAQMDVRGAPWEDVVTARQDIAKIIDNSLYYHPGYNLDNVRNDPNGDFYRYMSEQGRPPETAVPENYRPSIYTDPNGADDMKPIVDAAYEAMTHMLNARRAGVDALFRHGTVAEPASAVRKREAKPTDVMPSGFYFAAARKLADVPDTTFKLGAQAVINALAQAGVKRAEINHLQLDRLVGTGPVTRQQFQHAIGERIFDFKRKLSRMNPERSQKDYMMGGTRAFRGPRIPGRGTYFERLMAFPKKLAGGEPFAPGFFLSPHWKYVQENAWASWRGSLREVPDWGNMVIGEEGQTDYMQGARGEGARRPSMKSGEYLALKAERKKFEKVMNQVRDELLHPAREAGIPYQERENIIDAMMGKTKSGAPLAPDTWDTAMSELRARVDAIANPDTRAFANKSLDKAQSIHDKNPAYFAPGAYPRIMETEARFTPTTPIDESYVGTMVRDLLLHAAKEGADSVAIATSDSTRRIQVNDSAGHFYDQQLMPTLQRELRRITNDGGLKLQKVNLPKGIGGPKKEKPYTVWAAKLSPETRTKILTDGQPLFSLGYEGKPATQPRLAALHNLTEENLAFADSMGGGIAVPSIGIVKEGMGIGGFGEITLVGNRDIADPEKNPVFDADAYTARFPKPEYKKAKEKPTQKLINELRPFATKFKEPGDLEVVWDKLVNYPDAGGAISQMVRSEFGKAAFAKTVLGKDVEPVMRSAIHPEGEGFFVTMPAFAKIAEEFKDKRLDWTHGDDTHKRVSKALAAAIKQGVAKNREGKTLRPALRNDLARVWTEQLLDDDGLLPYSAEGWLNNAIRNIGKEIIDSHASKERLDEEIKGHEEAYKKWVEDKILPLYGDPYLTLNRKKVPYTLDNIVKSMTSEDVKGKEQTLAFGAGQVRAAAATRFTNMDWMRSEAEKGIQNPAEVEAARNKVEAALESYRMAVRPFFKYTDNWSAMDGAMRALGKTIASKNGRNAPNLRRELAKEDFVKVPDTVLQEGVAAAEMLLTAPVPYFEAKPQRVISLGEFQGAVVPNTASPAAIATLQKHGLVVRVYQRGNGVAGEQQGAAAKLAQDLATSHGTLFALKGFYSPAGRAIDAFPQPRATVAQWKALLTPGKIPGVTKDWGDFIGIDDVLAKLADDKGRVSKDELAAYIKTADVDLDLVTNLMEPSADEGKLRQELEADPLNPVRAAYMGDIENTVAEDEFMEKLSGSNAFSEIVAPLMEPDEDTGFFEYPSLRQLGEIGINVDVIENKAFDEEGLYYPIIVSSTKTPETLVFFDNSWELITDEYPSYDAAMRAVEGFKNETINKVIETANRSVPKTETKFHEYSIPGTKYVAELLVTASSIKGAYTSKHFGTNEILHRRLGEVTLSDGTRALVDIEGQSDAHALGDEEGYYTPESRKKELEAFAEAKAKRDEMVTSGLVPLDEKTRLANDMSGHNKMYIYEHVQEKLGEETPLRNEAPSTKYVRTVFGLWENMALREKEEIPVKFSVHEVLKSAWGERQIESWTPAERAYTEALAKRVLDAIPERHSKLVIKAARMRTEANKARDALYRDNPHPERPGGGMPNVPYKNGLWLELGSKLALRFAVENGYDAIVIPKPRMIGDAVGASRISSFEWKVSGNDLHVKLRDQDGNVFRDDKTKEEVVTVLKGDPEGGFGAAVGWIARKLSPEAAEQVRFDLAQGEKSAFQDNPGEPDPFYAMSGPAGTTGEAGTGYVAKHLMPEGGAANLGMQLQYDEKQPAFYAKYTAKWGGKVTDEQIGSLPDKPVLKVLRITPEMRAAIMAGQPLYALKGFYSAGRKAVETFQASASVEQWKALLKPGKIPGVTANWLAMTDLDGWLDGFPSGQKVKRDEVLAYIDATEQPVDEDWKGSLDPEERKGLTEHEAQNMARDNAYNIAEEQMKKDSVPQISTLSDSEPTRAEFDAFLQKMDLDPRDRLISFMRDSALGPEHGAYWAGGTDDIMNALFPEEEGAITPTAAEEAPLTTLEDRAKAIRAEVEKMRASDDMTGVLDRFDAIAKEFGQRPFSAQKVVGGQTDQYWGGPAIAVGLPDGEWAVVYGSERRPDLFNDLPDAQMDMESRVSATARQYWNDRDRRNDIYEEELASIRHNYAFRAETEYEDYNIPGVSYMAEIQITLPGFNWNGWEPPHFDKPNLVFMQLGETELPSGDMALMPVSIQSDVHQKGWNEGYATPSAIDEWRSAMDDYERDEKARREALGRVDTVREQFRSKAYEINRLQQDMTPKLWKAVREENSRELSVRDIPWYVAYEDVPDEARALMDKIDPEYGDKLEKLRADNKRLRDRADELTRDLPAKPEYPGEKPEIPDAPFKGDAAPELAVRKLLQLAVEHGYSHVVLPTAEQAAYAAGARKVTSLKWRRTDEGIEITPTQGDNYGNYTDNKPRMFKYGAGGDAASAYNQLTRRITKEATDKIKKAIDAGETDGELTKLSIVNFGMQRQYEDAIPNYASKLVKKLGGVVTIEKIPGLYGDRKNVVIEVTPKMRDTIEGGQPLYRPGALPEFTQSAPRKQVIQGYWSPRQRTIGIALSHGDPMEIFYEEAAHALGPKGLNLLSKTELSVLRAAALKEGWIEKYIDPANLRQYRAAYGYTGDVDGMLLEEAIAHRFADYAVTRDAEGLPEASRKVFDRIREFFRRTRRALNDKGAFTVGDIFGGMYTGDVGRRGKPMPPIRFHDLLPVAAGVSQLVAFDDLVPGQKPLIAFHDLVPTSAPGAFLTFDDLIPQRAASM